MPAILGCIADDFTGGTDLANTLVRQGMRTVQTCDLPADDLKIPDADAIIVSLKCRSIDPREAVKQCRSALAWLKKQGCQYFLWKYCSTFDSTPKGNIGPVAEALLNDLGADYTIVCPAFPLNGRTIYKGQLFVGDLPLSESSMRNHPVTPMRDSNLIRLLEPQVTEKVGLITWETIRQGADAINKALTQLSSNKVRYIVTDALEDKDLITLAEACSKLSLITGGSGIALGLPEMYRKQGLLKTYNTPVSLPKITGGTVILSGSCSEATRGQLARLAAKNEENSDTSKAPAYPMFQLDPLKISTNPNFIKQAAQWAKEQLLNNRIPVLYASDAPEAVAAVQKALGQEASGALIENALGELATDLYQAGATHFIVAGGESSGAVVKALKVPALQIGQQIAPGVPWTVSVDTAGKQIAITLKSGNFGGIDFFEQAVALQP
ncbi:3-oxo-tetronate kinase [Desulfovibrio litoralis]|uniref:3-oxo-tetronate kinase n=1 Tax=Desulfovibrio litoralis DSM 11393 TaxID=1121455 RepID=A0A1M7TMR3_9BACT|nr:3-oxo-tetronate kinase [Desulfovibrio litoralis]SHN71913.1 Uncharacterized conserved protein YgbK, DUF1537 family [Desulfovibrio litoralis DSM 11393]